MNTNICVKTDVLFCKMLHLYLHRHPHYNWNWFVHWHRHLFKVDILSNIALVIDICICIYMNIFICIDICIDINPVIPLALASAIAIVIRFVIWILRHRLALPATLNLALNLALHWSNLSHLCWIFNCNQHFAYDGSVSFEFPLDFFGSLLVSLGLPLDFFGNPLDCLGNSFGLFAWQSLRFPLNPLWSHGYQNICKRCPLGFSGASLGFPSTSQLQVSQPAGCDLGGCLHIFYVENIRKVGKRKWAWGRGVCGLGWKYDFCKMFWKSFVGLLISSDFIKPYIFVKSHFSEPPKGKCLGLGLTFQAFGEFGVDCLKILTCAKQFKWHVMPSIFFEIPASFPVFWGRQLKLWTQTEIHLEVQNWNATENLNWSSTGSSNSNYARMLSESCKDSVRILQSFCKTVVRILQGFCKNSVRILQGFCKDSAKIGQGFWKGSGKDTAKILHRFSRILEGSCKDSVRILWGSCEDSVRVLSRFFREYLRILQRLGHDMWGFWRVQ